MEDISGLKTDQALLKQKQDQTDIVIKDLRDNLKTLSINVLQFENKVTKGFYIALGVVLMASGSLSDIIKVIVKMVGG